jgi:hypothetical protein
MYRPSVAPSELSIRDEPAIGGYHRRLSSTAPLELFSRTVFASEQYWG